MINGINPLIAHTYSSNHACIYTCFTPTDMCIMHVLRAYIEASNVRSLARLSDITGCVSSYAHRIGALFGWSLDCLWVMIINENEQQICTHPNIHTYEYMKLKQSKRLIFSEQSFISCAQPALKCTDTRTHHDRRVGCGAEQ